MLETVSSDVNSDGVVSSSCRITTYLVSNNLASEGILARLSQVLTGYECCGSEVSFVHECEC